MALPPVVRRVRETLVSEEQLRGFVARQFYSREEVGGFGELFERFVAAVQSEAIHFVGLPEDDPYWRSAPQAQNLMSALRAYLLCRVREGQDDEGVLWALAAMEAGHCDNEFGRAYWVPLVLRDPSNVRWLVESALWVWRASGHDPTEGLRRSLADLTRTLRDVRPRLDELCSDSEPRMAWTARIARKVTEGSRIPDLVNKRHSVFPEPT